MPVRLISAVQRQQAAALAYGCPVFSKGALFWEPRGVYNTSVQAMIIWAHAPLLPVDIRRLLISVYVGQDVQISTDGLWDGDLGDDITADRPEEGL
jgi:hypothetical protein